MNKRHMISACAAVVAMAASSAELAPVVTLGDVSQHGDRVVNVPYTLANAPAVVTFAVETNNGASGWSRLPSSAVSTVKGDVNKLVPVGSHAITWRPAKDLQGVTLPSAGARVVVTAWATNNPPAYMVIDLLANSTDRIRYYEDESAMPYGGVLSNDIYRTTSLVMRKVNAKGIIWRMGSVSETGRVASYEKSHTVTNKASYYLSVFELTQRQHTLINGGTTPDRYFVTHADMRPSDCVKWTDLVDTVASGGTETPEPSSGSICGKLRDLTGIAFNIPGEADWEFAARAGCGDGYWPGGIAMSISSNADDNLPGRYKSNGGWPADQLSSNNIPKNGLDTNYATAVVGSYKPNAWGFYDMCGNVREWCRDWWVNDISDRGGAIVTIKDSQNYRAFRGGDIGDTASSCRPANRYMAGQGADWRNYAHFWGARLWAPCEAK